MSHWFWFSLTFACIVWYSTITVFVAFKGSGDIKQMLARLSEQRESRGKDETNDDSG